MLPLTRKLWVIKIMKQKHFKLVFLFITEAIIISLIIAFFKNTVWLAILLSVLSLAVTASAVYILFVFSLAAKLSELHAEIQQNIEKTDIEHAESISVIAHELRSPMTSVKGYLTALKDGIINTDENEKYIKICIDETDKCIKMLENFMSISRFDANSINLKKESFDVNELIRRVLIEKIPAIEAKNIEPSIQFSEETTIVFADKQYITLVISNLIDNAIKYGKSEIILSTKIENSKIIVSVTDNGTGISEDDIPHIWERFYQVQQKKDEYTGHGLGLALVKEIISAHGENIDVVSELHIGSTFSFTLSSPTQT